MVVFKSRKQKNLKKRRKNKTRHLKNNRRNYTLKKSKHKSYRKTRRYYNARQYLGGAGNSTNLTNLTNLTNIVLQGANDDTNIGLGNEPIYFIGAVAVFFMLVICGCWLYNLRPRNQTRESSAQIELATAHQTPRLTHRGEPSRLGVTPTLGEVCSICLEPMNEGESTTATMPCGHVFHEECITSWIGHGGSCPNCRANVTSLRPIVLEPAPSQREVTIEVGESSSSIKNPPEYDDKQDPAVSAGGGPSILDTIARLASEVKNDDFQETLDQYFTFLKLTPKDYDTILKLLRNISKADNLGKLVEIVAVKLGFICHKNVKSTTYDSDKMLVEVLGADVEKKIKNIMQNCNMASDLKLKPKMVGDVKDIRNIRNIRNILGITLINYISDPTLEQNKQDLLVHLQEASNTLNAH